MNELLATFSAVEIKVSDHLPKEDVRFCEGQQAAYESAFQSYLELSFVWEEMARAHSRNTSDDFWRAFSAQGYACAPKKI